MRGVFHASVFPIGGADQTVDMPTMFLDFQMQWTGCIHNGHIISSFWVSVALGGILSPETLNEFADKFYIRKKTHPTSSSIGNMHGNV